MSINDGNPNEAFVVDFNFRIEYEVSVCVSQSNAFFRSFHFYFYPFKHPTHTKNQYDSSHANLIRYTIWLAESRDTDTKTTTSVLFYNAEKL